MTAEGFNELLQWMALISVLLLTLAMYRRLGMMYLDAREQKLAQFGPPIGSPVGRIGETLWNGHPRRGPSLFVFTREGCSLCEELLEQLWEWGIAQNGSIEVSVVAAGSPTYVRGVRDRFTLFRVLNQEDVKTRLRSVPSSFPFSLLIDEEGVVVTKTLGPDLASLKSAFQQSRVRTGSPSELEETIRDGQ